MMVKNPFSDPLDLSRCSLNRKSIILTFELFVDQDREPSSPETGAHRRVDRTIGVPICHRHPHMLPEIRVDLGFLIRMEKYAVNPKVMSEFVSQKMVGVRGVDGQNQV